MKGERNVYKVEIKPGVGFSQGFKTKIEALVFIRDFNNILKEFGIVPFQCEIIEIKERSVIIGECTEICKAQGKESPRS